jgi:hypothetical protein
VLIELPLIDGFPVPTIRCSTCGDRIRDGKLAAVVWNAETGDVVVVHKGRPCDPGWDQWEDLDCVLAYLLVRLGLDDVVAEARKRGWRDPDSFREAA